MVAADLIAIGLRAVAYAAALQAAGIVIFRWLFGCCIDRSSAAIATAAARAALAGVLLTLAHAAVEPARLTGELAGIFDPSLQTMLLSSDAGVAFAIRVLGGVLILAGCVRCGRVAEATALLGTFLIVASFAFMGHTASDDRRWLLAPLLIMHLLAIAYWFGGLVPLAMAVRRENPSSSGELLERYSRLAVWLAPAVLVAGSLIAALLLRDLSGLRTAYGTVLIAKIAGFGLLMGLAAANKWRYSPRILQGDLDAVVALRRIVLTEWFLIVIVIAMTATMTALFTPGH